jgi:hypothetical protein
MGYVNELPEMLPALLLHSLRIMQMSLQYIPVNSPDLVGTLPNLDPTSHSSPYLPISSRFQANSPVISLLYFWSWATKFSLRQGVSKQYIYQILLVEILPVDISRLLQ